MLLAGLERTLNALLSRDPAAPSRLARLDGSRLLFRLERPSTTLLVGFHERGLHLSRPQITNEDIADAAAVDAAAVDAAAVDAVVEIDTEALGELLAGQSIERLMFRGSLTVRGQIQRLEQARELILDLDLDWENELANWLGNQPAHSLAEGLRRLARWGLRTHHELSADLGEYVFEEGRLLPGRDQLEVLRDHLTELEMTSDRLEARLERLRRRIDAQPLDDHKEASA